MSEPGALEVAGLSVELGGRRVVEGVDFVVPAGTILGLVGESGSGKTSIARAIVGSVPAAAGEIRLAGTVLRRRRSAGERRAVQLIPQDPFGSLNPMLRIGQVFDELLRQVEPGSTRQQRRRSAAALLELVELPASVLEGYPRRFSGGQRQRIAIARALAVRPSVLIADEPTSSLDVSVQRTVLGLLAELAASRRLATVLISHDLSVIHASCDQVVVLRAGRVLEQAPAQDFFSAPRHPYSQELLAAVPRMPQS